jgi:hypothetical protein
MSHYIGIKTVNTILYIYGTLGLNNKASSLDSGLLDTNGKVSVSDFDSYSFDTLWCASTVKNNLLATHTGRGVFYPVGGNFRQN